MFILYYIFNSYNVIINCVIYAPGNNVLDGLNAVEKRFLFDTMKNPIDQGTGGK